MLQPIFEYFKKKADDTKGSFQFLRSNCPVRFADLVIDVKLFAGSGQGDKVELSHIFV